MPKPKKPIREMHRWEKMAAGAADMEELLVRIREWLRDDHRAGTWFVIFAVEIERQLKRTGRLK